MPKDITIKKDGASTIYSGVERIKTHEIESGTTVWIADDETKTGTKTVKKNGTYKAANDGFYGYSKVIVKTKAKAIGKKQDGKTYGVGVDDNGNLYEELEPDRIKITTQPTKLQYNDGEDIDFTGGVVKAYSDANTIWEGQGYTGGIIPLNELTLKPAKASISGTPSFNDNQITVQWERPDDGEPLTDTFEISVESNTDNGGGS